MAVCRIAVCKLLYTGYGYDLSCAQPWAALNAYRGVAHQHCDSVDTLAGQNTKLENVPVSSRAFVSAAGPVCWVSVTPDFRFQLLDSVVIY